MIRFACPSCGFSLSAPEDCAGRSSKCRACGQAFQVPAPVATLITAPSSPPIRCRCPRCQQSLEAPAEQGGQKTRCPKCGQPIQLPAAPPKPAAQGQPQPLPLTVPPPFVGQPPAPTASGTTQFNCPHCHSTQTIKVSLVYERETVHSQSAGLFTGIGVSRRGIGGLLGTSQQSTLHQTAMAKRLQPPQPARLSAGLKWACAGMILLGLAGLGGFKQATDSRSGKSPAESVLLALVCLGGAVLCAVAFARGKQKVEKWNAEEYPRLMAAWEASWLCQQCGTTFVAWKAKSGWESGA
jgi:hypothetical protein